MFDELAEGFELFRPTCGLCKGPCPPQRESRAVANFVVCVDCDGGPPVDHWRFELGEDAEGR